MDKKVFFSRLNSFLDGQSLKDKKVLIKKIKTLYKATYDFYLTLYLIDVVKNKKVDLPAFEYLSGRVICESAATNAMAAVDRFAISRGTRRINKCYKSYLRYRNSILRG